jgi:hypothetical protein
MSPFNQIIIAFGGQAMLLIVLGFLARSLIQSLLAKDLKRFETDLQTTAALQLERQKSDLKAQADTSLERLRSELKAQGDASIEQLKTRLQQATIEHQVRFAKLHEKRAEVIAEVYERLVDAEQQGYRFASVEGFMPGTDEQREARMKTQGTMFDLKLLIEKRHIYLPTQICTVLKGHLDNMANHVFGVGSYGAVRALTSQEQVEQQKVFAAACTAFAQDIPAARRALEDEFRRMLDVERSPSLTT